MKVTTLATRMAASTTFGHIDKFRPELESFSTYREQLELFFIANKIEDDRQVAVLLSVIGTKHYSLLHSLVAPSKPADKSVAELLSILGSHLEPAPLVIAERFCFYKRVQDHHESVAQFVAELRRLATHCQFSENLDDALRDRLVCGLKPALEGAQKKLLGIKDLTLQKAVEVAAGFESVEKSSKEIREQPDPQVDVHLVKEFCKKEVQPPRYNLCFHCGRAGHSPSKCRFKNLSCHNCGRTGHIAVACRAGSGKVTQRGGRKAQVCQLDDVPEDSSPPLEDELGEFNIDVVSTKSPPIKVSLELNGQDIDMIVDTGAEVTIITEEVMQSLDGVSLEDTDITLTTYTAEKLLVLGQCSVLVKYRDFESKLPTW